MINPEGAVKIYWSCCQSVLQIHKCSENNSSLFYFFILLLMNRRHWKYTDHWEYLQLLILWCYVDNPEADIHVFHWGPSFFLSKQQYYPDVLRLAPEIDQWAPSTLYKYSFPSVSSSHLWADQHILEYFNDDKNRSVPNEHAAMNACNCMVIITK